MQRKTDNTARSMQINVEPTNRSERAPVHLTLVNSGEQSSAAPTRRKLSKEEAVRDAMMRTG